ncbi:hypothetical protein BH09BAC1_BH09BAC1_29560 [soil metagenome]
MCTGISLRIINHAGISYLFCGLFFLLILPLHAQQLKQEDPLASLYHQKKVKNITAFEQGAADNEQAKVFYKEYNAAGKLVFELVYAEGGKVVKKYQGVYNSENRLTKEIWVQDDTDSVTYKYKNGKLTEESWYWGADKSRTRVVHFFDTIGRKVCTVSKNSWGVYVDSFFYQNDRILQAKNYNEHGLLNSVTENLYDAKGRITKALIQDEKGITLQTTNTLYLETGPVKSLETILYAPPSKTNVTAVAASMAENYKYDTQKQLKEVNVQSYTNNELLVNSKTTYVYGDKGLPISQTTQNLATSSKQVLRFTYAFF